jgi:4-hydroxy-2-oxoheptanedioate aldolase
MTTARRRLKHKLAKREQVVGVVVDYASPGLVEFLGGLKFDVAFIDCEHAGPGIESVADMVRAARLGDIATVLRPWSKEPGLVRRFLDCGVDGIIAPEIESATEAQAMLDIIVGSHPPDVENIIFIPLIESKAGVEHAEEILRVKGVDAVAIGTSDLAVSMGFGRRGDHPDLRKTTYGLLALTRAAGKSVVGPSAKYGLDVISSGGANFVFYSVKDLLKTGAAAALAEVAAAGGVCTSFRAR